MSMDQAALMAALQSVIDPNTGKDFVSTKLLKNLRAQGASVSFDVTLGYPARSQIAPIRQMLEDAARSVPGVQQATANVDFKIIAHSVQRGVPLLPGVKNMIAVASGKGGVGKSTTAANLALALAAEGARVGMLDADIYGPSQPTMMGVHGSPEHDGQAMQPLIGHGVQVNSIGLMVKQGQAMIWRGPMVTQALDQLMRQTAWHDVDYLIVDMPPGTGDVQLSISQRAPVTGAVIVTTPQDIALMDARRGIAMFEKVGVPILGVVENMAVHRCTQCGHEEHIFGAGGGQRMAEEYKVDYLGGLPLSLSIREQADSGCPTVVAAPDSAEAATYRAIARRIAVKVAEQAKDYSSRFPTITVSNT